MEPTPALEFVHALRELKSDIRNAVNASIKKFSDATGGLTPETIRIEMLEATTIGDHFRKYVLGRVDVDLGIQ